MLHLLDVRAVWLRAMLTLERILRSSLRKGSIVLGATPRPYHTEERGLSPFSS